MGKKQNIKIAIAYHQNIYDTVISLKKIMNVELFTPKIKNMSSIPQEMNCKKLYCHVGRTNARAIYTFKELWKHITKKTDFVMVKHINEPTNFFTYIVCRIKKIPIIINVQKVNHLKLPLYKIFLKILIKFIGKETKVFSVTKEGLRESKKYFKNSKYIPVCINPLRFEQKKYPKNKEFNILYVSRFQERKKNDLLLHALKELNTKHDISFKLKLVSILTSKYSKEYSRIINLIEKLTLEDKISVVINEKSENMVKQYHSADLLVFPATSEPLGFNLVEAMACGLAVTCSREVGSKCYIKEGKNGYVFEPNSAKAIVKTIERFIDQKKINHQKLKLFGEKSRLIIENDHSPSVFINKFKELIEQ
jgi:glycosyltransferase involved in cell wall biosynthesis